MVPVLDGSKVLLRDPCTMATLTRGVEEHGFLVVENTTIAAADVLKVIDMYRAFFKLPDGAKTRVDMARTGANRGWGRAGSEQVDPDANPDYKEVFDSGFELAENDPLGALAVYAPNLWPQTPVGFQSVISEYYRSAMGVAMDILRAIATVMGKDAAYFDDKFSKPMALLRGNYYPSRPDWAGDMDFGIAEHTDYGCVTLLATDGVAGLEAKTRADTWVPVTAKPGSFIINFGEMLQMWTDGQVRATPHRVRGTADERISVPLFFNPNYDTNVAPMSSQTPILAGEHLTKRFQETYLHLKK